MKQGRPNKPLLALMLAAYLALGTAWAKAPSTKPGGGGSTTVSHTARQARPISLGVSGGNVLDLANGYCCSGTLGALVEDAAGTQYILSNTHVFAGDSAAGGNGDVSRVGDPIDQPGLVDIRCQDVPADYVAYVSDWAPLIPGGTSSVDAALAEVVPGMVKPTGDILEIGTISSTPAPAQINQAVKKSGRTSGVTTGKVVALDATVTVTYGTECAGPSYVSTFTGQILVSPGKFLKSGDSGSLMLENKPANPCAVGLLFAGSSRVAVANPIQDVLDTFGMTLVGAASAAAGAAETPLTGASEASKAKAKASAALLSVPGAVGHAVGSSGTHPNRAVIKVLVEEITPEAQKAAPRAVEGIPVELLAVGEIVAY